MRAILAFLGGRGRRREYWTGIAIIFAFAFIIRLLGVPTIWSSVLTLLLWIPVSGRRLHDVDASAWWSLAPFTAGFVLGALGPVLGPAVGLLGIAFNLLIVVLLIGLGVRAGDRGSNRFGLPPGVKRTDVATANIFN